MINVHKIEIEANNWRFQVVVQIRAYYLQIRIYLKISTILHTQIRAYLEISTNLHKTLICTV